MILVIIFQFFGIQFSPDLSDLLSDLFIFFIRQLILVSVLESFRLLTTFLHTHIFCYLMSYLMKFFVFIFHINDPTLIFKFSN